MSDANRKTRGMKMIRETSLITHDFLTVYYIGNGQKPGERFAGPHGYDVNAINITNLPEGFRWVSNREYEEIMGFYWERATTLDSRY